MDMAKAEKLFQIVDEEKKIFYAKMPRCVLLDKSLSPMAKLIYAYLKARCSSKSSRSITWVSQKIIGEDLDISTRWVRLNIKALVTKGLVEVRSIGDGFSKHNVYLMKDPLKVYGEEALKPWPKRDFASAQGNHSSSPDRNHSSSPDRNHSSSPDRNHSSSKEEEAKESEFKNQKEEEEPGATLPAVVPAAVASGGATLTLVDCSIAKDWRDFAIDRMPWMAKSKLWTIESFSKQLMKVRKATDLNEDGLRALLQFLKDDDFWSTKGGISPFGLLKRTSRDNTVRKIDNMLVAMRSNKQFKEQDSYAKAKRSIELGLNKSPF